jgi:phosphonate ABC transporter permease subunit PhnE
MMNNQTPPRSRHILRRLIILIVIAIVLVIFSYGWRVTNINLSVPQEPQRQQNVGKALRELLSPNVFTQDYVVKSFTANFRMRCAEDAVIPPNNASDQPYIIVEPTCGMSNDVVTVYGYNFPANGLTRLNWIPLDGERRVRQVIGSEENNFLARGDGTFEVQILVPQIRGSNNQIHTIEAQARIPDGPIRFSDTTNLVMEKMVETIFLALIATAVSILPSAVLSFMAAHNLMRPIRAQFGSLMVSFTLLPVGWVLGTWLLKPIGEFAYNAGSQSGFTALVMLIIVMVEAWVVITNFDTLKSLIPIILVRRVVNTVVITVSIIVVVSLLGGLGILFQKTFAQGVFIYLGGFIGSLGQMIKLSLEPIAGLVGAFAISSLGTNLTRDLIKNTDATFNHLLGGLLGALGGAILLGMTATIGLSAAWMGLLIPVIGGALATTLLPQAYRWFVPKPEVPNLTDRNILRALAWMSGIIGFVITFTLLNVGQSLVEGMLPPQVPVMTIGDATLYRYVAVAMLIGAVFGGLAGALGGAKGNFPLGAVIYNTNRTILNTLRSIEPLIMGLVFVIWVGIGPFAGVLALALHSIASLGKLYSEQIESIDAGPIEALQSTGANRLQTIMYAVVPQIIPPYIAFTMYRWDINVRMSTIIGFVGGGGVGFLLQQQINLLQYRNAGVAVLAIAIVVSILDYASAAIRERYT